MGYARDEDDSPIKPTAGQQAAAMASAPAAQAAAPSAALPSHTARQYLHGTANAGPAPSATAKVAAPPAVSADAHSGEEVNVAPTSSGSGAAAAPNATQPKTSAPAAQAQLATTYLADLAAAGLAVAPTTTTPQQQHTAQLDTRGSEGPAPVMQPQGATSLPQSLAAAAMQPLQLLSMQTSGSPNRPSAKRAAQQFAGEQPLLSLSAPSLPAAPPRQARYPASTAGHQLDEAALVAQVLEVRPVCACAMALVRTSQQTLCW